MLSCEEREVLGLIEGRMRGNPITDAEISRLTGIATREVADIVKRLLQIHSQPIGAAKEPPYGRYMIQTREELERYLASLLSMQRSISDRVNALNTAFRTRQGKEEQMVLEV